MPDEPKTKRSLREETKVANAIVALNALTEYERQALGELSRAGAEKILAAAKALDKLDDDTASKLLELY